MIGHLPLRVRLTLWYSVVFAAALFSLGFACLWMVHSAVTNLEDNELQQRVKSVRLYLESRPKGESPQQLRDAFTAAYDVYHGHKWLQVIDERGVWAYRSPHVADVYPSLVRPSQAAPSGSYFTYETEGLHVRALIEPIAVHGVHYTVQTGLTLDKTLGILSNFRVQLMALTTFGLVFSSLAGYFMSRKALTPIAAIAAEARRINDKNLNIRLPELQTRDELAALSLTLNQMLARIESGYQSVRSFTANAAHELRSPVALLRAEAEVALAFPRDAGYYRDACQHVLASSLQMSRTIDQLLTLARMDAKVEVLHFEPIHLPDLVEEVAEEWSPRFAEARIAFLLNLGKAEFWIQGDFAALKRLCHILLENAWRYTPSGGSVTMSVEQIGPAAELSVADTGVGISTQNRSRIFERFCRIARPLHGEFAGSGLGLALGQGIAELHRSTIEVRSVLGSGSRFSLVLGPVRHQDDCEGGFLQPAALAESRRLPTPQPG